MRPRDHLRVISYDYEERDTCDERPCLVLTDTDISRAFDKAQPSTLMTGSTRLFSRIAMLTKTILLLGLLAAYPYFMVKSSQIDDSPVVFAAGQDWDAGHAGVSVMLIARELKGVGLADGKPLWHPQSRLTALPAWQAAKMSALAEHTHLMSAFLDGDEDLDAAARLLGPSDRRDGIARLSAAAEALARYDSRVEKHGLVAPAGKKVLAAELELYAGWGAALRTQLASLVSEASAWPAGRPEIAAFYAARARAHVAHELLAASVRENDVLLRQAGLEARAVETLAAWRRAASQQPLFVSNQSGADLFMPNHLAAMIFYSDAATASSLDLAGALEAYEPPTAMAGRDVALLNPLP